MTHWSSILESLDFEMYGAILQNMKCIIFDRCEISPSRKSLHEPFFVSDGQTIRCVQSIWRCAPHPKSDQKKTSKLKLSKLRVLHAKSPKLMNKCRGSCFWGNLPWNREPTNGGTCFLSRNKQQKGFAFNVLATLPLLFQSLSQVWAYLREGVKKKLGKSGQADHTFSKGSPAWHNIMYYTHEKCFRAIWGNAGPFWVMKGHFWSWRVIFGAVLGHYGAPVGLWKGPRVVQHDI